MQAALRPAAAAVGRLQGPSGRRPTLPPIGCVLGRSTPAEEGPSHSSDRREKRQTVPQFRALPAHRWGLRSGSLRQRGWVSASPRRQARIAVASSAPQAAAPRSGKSSGVDLQVVGTAGLVVCLSVSNRVLQKLALVPMKPYVFFLGLALTLVYVVAYGLILLRRRRTGRVTDEMLRVPMLPFVAIGFMECLAQVVGLFAASSLPGSMLPILGQTFLIWQFIFSGLLLKTKYNARHFAGAALVLLGLVVVNEPSAWAVGPAGAREMLFPIATFTASTLMFAVDSIFKEKIFRDYRAKKGRQLDIFVVNTFGSCWQALFTFLLLPANAALRGVAPSRLPEYLRDGLACFVGCTPQSCALDGHSCGGAPLLPLLYIGVNLALNVSALRMMRSSSAVVASLVSSIAVPLTVLAFTLPLPFLGAGKPLARLPRPLCDILVVTLQFWLGTALLFLGLLVYQTARLSSPPPPPLPSSSGGGGSTMSQPPPPLLQRGSAGGGGAPGGGGGEGSSSAGSGGSAAAGSSKAQQGGAA